MALDIDTANSLAAEIVAEVVQRRGPPSEEGMTRAPGPQEFCNIWPQAKPVLGLVVGIVSFIPGAGANAAAVLQGLIKIGDQLAAQICKS
jgi:hypothetical protein